jgi:transcriptional regulator with XRE-family HTH domain
MANQYGPNSRLQWFRRQQNVTQSELAEIMGVTQRTVQRWESGESTPRGYARKKICRYFQATPVELGFLTTGLEGEQQEQISQPKVRSGHGGNHSTLSALYLAGVLLILTILLALVVIRLFW